MWINSLLMAVIGLSAGFTVAAGLGAFIIELGVISDFADRTHTGEHVLLYEDSAALGGILGNLFYIYQIAVPGGGRLFLRLSDCSQEYSRDAGQWRSPRF